MEDDALLQIYPNSDGRRQRLYHGTRVDLKPGDLIAPGYASNYGKQKKATFVYLNAVCSAHRTCWLVLPKTVTATKIVITMVARPFTDPGSM
jgi:hypothetical protein